MLYLFRFYDYPYYALLHRIQQIQSKTTIEQNMSEEVNLGFI